MGERLRNDGSASVVSRKELFQDHSQHADVVKVAAALVCVAVIVAGLFYGRDVLIPLAIAFLISFALNPVVAWFERIGLPRVLAVILVITTALGILGGFGLLLGSQVRSLSQDLPTYQSTIRTKIADLRTQFATSGILDRALATVDTLQREVQVGEAPSGENSRPQRVELVPQPKSPFQTAFEWLTPSLAPIATAGIVFVFVCLVLLDRRDLRDRLLRMLGGNLHRSTDAMEEAGSRISKYLLMQLMVNVSYGVPIGLGLWFIGVPGALLWGTVAAVMRFVPYVGPMISAIFPIALAFAVDPGWNMVIWTVALILVLEIVSNNVVEPLLYGSSTGLSAMSLMVSAMFWTALWGPLGLVLSTPLTVCLLVVGRNLPQLRFLDTLLGSTPALNLPTRIYQRLLADDPDEAIAIVNEEIETTSVRDFYNDVGIEVLRLASEDHLRHATAEHRLRVANGMDALLDDLRDEYAAPDRMGAPPRVTCIGGKWQIDSVSAEMLAHALSLEGVPADFRPAGVLTGGYLDKLDLKQAGIVCVTYFNPEPEKAAKHFCRRLRHRWPGLRIVLALWNAPAELLEADPRQRLGADDVVASVEEGVRRIHRMVAPAEALAAQTAQAPDNDDERVRALGLSGVLDGRAREELDELAKRAAEAFDVGFAVISAIDADREFIIGQSRHLPGTPTADGTDMITMPRTEAVCDHVVSGGETLVVPDTKRDPRFADHPAITLWKTRFYAGAPLRTEEGHVFGALCLLDTRPRDLEKGDEELLEALATDVVAAIVGQEGGNALHSKSPSKGAASLGRSGPE